MNRIGDWIEDHLGWCIVALVCGMVWLIVMAVQSDEKQCNELLALSRTSRDTLDAKIACQQLQASTAQSISIGIAAGAVAGSAASRR